MYNPSDYTITIKRVSDKEGDFFKATVKEIPHVQGIGKTFSEAYEIALDAIDGLQQMAAEDGAPFPEPAKDLIDEWSGRVTLRLPKSLHRQAAELADTEGVSFNQFLVTVVADAVARQSAVTTYTVNVGKKARATMHAQVAGKFWSAQQQAVLISGGGYVVTDLIPQATHEVETSPYVVPGFIAAQQLKRQY